MYYCKCIEHLYKVQVICISEFQIQDTQLNVNCNSHSSVPMILCSLRQPYVMDATPYANKEQFSSCSM